MRGLFNEFSEASIKLSPQKLKKRNSSYRPPRRAVSFTSYKGIFSSLGFQHPSGLDLSFTVPRGLDSATSNGCFKFFGRRLSPPSPVKYINEITLLAQFNKNRKSASKPENPETKFAYQNAHTHTHTIIQGRRLLTRVKLNGDCVDISIDIIWD